ncbi:MAG: hemerythrin-like metal-binding protein [Clostridiaceae bacterium]|jgi:hemerythrin|nr:hemerythrin-like metal-binding protein [Clostridiaceae bacterium]
MIKNSKIKVGKKYYERCDYMQMLWDSKLAVGVDKIDNQHKELFNRINSLMDAMKEGKGKNEVMGTLDFLEEYVNRHFSDEEELQRKNNYPKIEIQHKEHEEFKMALKDLRMKLEEQGVSAMLAINLQQSMCGWWKKHIKELDMDLGKYLMSV